MLLAPAKRCFHAFSAQEVLSEALHAVKEQKILLIEHNPNVLALETKLQLKTKQVTVLGCLSL